MEDGDDEDEDDHELKRKLKYMTLTELTIVNTSVCIALIKRASS